MIADAEIKAFVESLDNPDKIWSSIDSYYYNEPNLRGSNKPTMSFCHINMVRMMVAYENWDKAAEYMDLAIRDIENDDDIHNIKEMLRIISNRKQFDCNYLYKLFESKQFNDLHKLIKI